MSTTEQAPTQDEIEIEPLPAGVHFASRGRHLTVERVIPRRSFDAHGNAYLVPGTDYEFQDGNLIVYPGQDVIADRFNRETGQMEEQDVVEWLRGHQLYGLERGFWEVAPVAPDPAPLMGQILRLAVRAGNPETREEAEGKIADLYEIEIASWKRQTVLDACKAALAAVESNRELPEPPPAEPWLGSAGSRQDPPPPPGFTRGEDGVLKMDDTSGIPLTDGFKPTDLNAPFNPPGGVEAPPQE